jgi:hypothetical protein
VTGYDPPETTAKTSYKQFIRTGEQLAVVVVVVPSHGFFWYTFPHAAFIVGSLLHE